MPPSHSIPQGAAPAASTWASTTSPPSLKTARYCYQCHHCQTAYTEQTLGAAPPGQLVILMFIPQARCCNDAYIPYCYSASSSSDTNFSIRYALVSYVVSCTGAICNPGHPHTPHVLSPAVVVSLFEVVCRGHTIQIDPAAQKACSRLPCMLQMPPTLQGQQGTALLAAACHCTITVLMQVAS